jgi:hypothetical protein
VTLVLPIGNNDGEACVLLNEVTPTLSVTVTADQVTAVLGVKKIIITMTIMQLKDVY